MSKPKTPSIRELRRLLDKARKILGSGAVQAWDLGTVLNKLFAKKAWKRLPEAKEYHVHGSWSSFVYRHLGLSTQQQMHYRRIARVYKRGELKGVSFGAAKLCANIKDSGVRASLLHCTVVEVQDKLSRMSQSQLVYTCSRPRSRPVIRTLNDIQDFLVKHPDSKIELSAQGGAFAAMIKFGSAKKSETYIGRDGALWRACDASALAFKSGRRRAKKAA